LKKITLLLLISFISSVGFSDQKEFFFKRKLEKDSNGRGKKHSLTMTLNTMDQLINHADPSDTRTFKQRYYVDDGSADNASSPVFLYICGEATCNSDDVSSTSVATLAQQQHGYLVSLEHRYYGESQPFDQLTTENLQYLSVDNAIEDLAAFQRYLTSTLGLRGKWFVTGGSYAGSLSAYYRMKHPELVAGSLASSGPVQSHENFEEYDKYVTTVAGSTCAPIMKKVSDTIEASMDNPTQFAAYQHQFQADVLTNPVDFLYYIADMGSMAVQYGFKDSFCSAIQSGTDPVASYAAQAIQISQAFSTSALEDSVQGSMSTDPKDYMTDVGARQWWYQSCTEFGYFQTAYHDPAYSTRSQKINMAYHLDACKRLFGVPLTPNTQHITDVFYSPLLSLTTTNILFTNGSNDPWSQLSISKVNGNDVNPKVTLYTIAGGAHCDDLNQQNMSASQTTAKQMFDDLVTKTLQQ
jgi:pimeloyl-ACP methyl ester carboxylesterase